MIKENSKKFVRRMIIALLLSFTVFSTLMSALSTINARANESITDESIEKCVVESVEIMIESESEDGFVYIENISFPKEHQEYLYELCIERGLDYLKTLAVLKHESQFDPRAYYKSSYGYMQIHKVNHSNLSKALGTANSPYDPYVNINWGTHMLKNLYDTFTAEGISDEITDGEAFSKLDKYVMSAYNRGLGGFKKYGEAVSYLQKVGNEHKLLENEFTISINIAENINKENRLAN